MDSFKIFEIANELNTTSDVLMAICKKLGIKVKSNGSSIDEEQKNLLVAEFNKKPSRAEKKSPAKKTGEPAKARPVKKAPVKKSSTSKIKWIKITDSGGAGEDDSQETEELEEETVEQVTISEVKKVEKEMGAVGVLKEF